MFEIIKYTPEHFQEWNDFVTKSKNGTFLFDRHYMDYHSDRFEDWSLLFYNESKLFAILPANKACEQITGSGGSIFVSHGGLTYGGLIMSALCTAEKTCILFQELKTFLKAQGFSSLIYKCVPHIYHRQPAEEDLYALFKECDAQLISRNISSAILLQDSIKWRYSRRYEANKARKMGLIVKESSDLTTYWHILEDNLRQKYGTNPVHTLEEITLLQHRFPQNIRLFAAFKEERMLGGVLLFISHKVVHTQYISASPEGKQCSAIDLIIENLLKGEFPNHEYFDIGTSNADGGKTLCTSLIHQKEGFGGRAICYDTYQLVL